MYFGGIVEIEMILLKASVPSRFFKNGNLKFDKNDILFL